jgi:hypothetical protein
MQVDDIDVPVAFLNDALVAFEDLPVDGLDEELHSHLQSLHMRLQALINSTEMFQRRLSNSRVRTVRRRSAPPPSASVAAPADDLEI